MADQFPMLSLTPDVPDPVAPSAAPAQSIQQQPAAPASTTAEPLAAPTAAARSGTRRMSKRPRPASTRAS